MNQLPSCPWCGPRRKHDMPYHHRATYRDMRKQLMADRSLMTRLTNFNVAISVLSLFVLVAKLIGFIMRVWTPIVGLIFSLAMSVLYTVSVYGQMGPDYYDPLRPSPIAWYIRMGCWPAEGFANDAVRSCQLAKGTFAVTVVQLYVLNSPCILGFFRGDTDLSQQGNLPLLPRPGDPEHDPHQGGEGGDADAQDEGLRR